MKTLLIISLITITGCGSLESKPSDVERSVQTISDACTFGEVRAYRHVTREERVELICK